MGNIKKTTSKSHVHGLLEKIAAAPALIAPERKEELKELIKKYDIELHISDNGETNFDMGTMFGKLFTPMRAYHHLWASALFFAGLYIERDNAEKEGKQEIVLTNPDIEYVMANYLLSCQCFKEKKDFPLPSNAKMITRRNDYIELADELFLTMVAFCLLHEIAHLERGDSKMDEQENSLNQIDPYEIEFSADKWAYQWMLDKWNLYSSDSRVFIKRILGVIFSLAQFDEFSHHKKESLSSSHPSAPDRLIRLFEDYKDEIDQNYWKGTCLTATYFGFQVPAFANDYLLPVDGYSTPLEFLNIVKTTHS